MRTLVGYGRLPRSLFGSMPDWCRAYEPAGRDTGQVPDGVGSPAGRPDHCFLARWP